MNDIVVNAYLTVCVAKILAKNRPNSHFSKLDGKNDKGIQQSN